MNPTFRDLLKRHLPEPYLTQALANYESQNPNGLDPGCCNHDSLEDVVLSAFTWRETPEGYDYWSAASRGEFQTPALRLEVGKRYLTQDGRTAGPLYPSPTDFLESGYPFSGVVEGEELPLSWSSDGLWVNDFIQRHLDLVSEIVEAEPATHRLLEPGETILEGDEYRFNSGDDGEWRPYVALVGTPFKGDNFSQSRRPLTAAPTPNPEARLDILESRIAVLEDRLAEPVATVEESGSAAGDPGEGYRLLEDGEIILKGDEFLVAWTDDVWLPRSLGIGEPWVSGLSWTRRRVASEPEEGYPTTPPEPGVGYRLLEKGDPIIRGKAEAWHPEENRWYLGPVRGFEGDTFDPDTDYWFREPAPVAVDPGDGYRLLEEGETILEGDEEADGEEGGGWSATSHRNVGDTFTKNNWYPVRRKLPTAPEVDPGEGYRLLEEGEVIEAGDEVYLEFNKSWARYLTCAIGQKQDPSNIGRRKLPTAPEVNPGEGYRLVEKGEFIEAGDEWLEGGKWVETGVPGLPLSIDNPLRRKLPARYPTTPLPEGFDRWECRGLGWRGPHGVWFTTAYPENNPWWDDAASSGPTGGYGNLEYWEAVKDGLPKPPTYRLLNPGELIREGDEALANCATDKGEADEWSLSTTIGELVDPRRHLPIRRPLKTYEDA